MPVEPSGTAQREGNRSSSCTTSTSTSVMSHRWVQSWLISSGCRSVRPSRPGRAGPSSKAQSRGRFGAVRATSLPEHFHRVLWADHDAAPRARAERGMIRADIAPHDADQPHAGSRAFNRREHQLTSATVNRAARPGDHGANLSSAKRHRMRAIDDGDGGCSFRPPLASVLNFMCWTSGSTPFCWPCKDRRHTFLACRS